MVSQFMLTKHRLILWKLLKGVVLSVKEQRGYPHRKQHPNVDFKTRAKRYERLMKANGINPNGGPDPKPSPLSTPKVPRSRENDGVAKPPSKKRRTNNATATTAETVIKEEAPVTASSKVEQTSHARAEDKKSSPANSSSTPKPIENQLGPFHQEENSFDFNEFCSPEMFQQCANDASHFNQRDHSAPALVPPMETVSDKRVHETPQPFPQEMKMTKKPERETVVIAD